MFHELTKPSANTLLDSDPYTSVSAFGCSAWVSEENITPPSMIISIYCIRGAE